MKRVLCMICVLMLTLLPAGAESRSGARWRAQNYAVDGAGNVYWRVNYSREHHHLLFTVNDEWGEIYRLNPEAMTCEKVADSEHALARIDCCGDELYIKDILRKYDLLGVTATLTDYRVPIERVGDRDAWEAYRDESSYGVSPAVHDDARYLTCMDGLFVMDGGTDTLSIVEDGNLRAVASCLNVYSQYDTFLELMDEEEHLMAAQTRIYDPAGDRVIILLFGPMALNNDCTLLDGDGLYQIGEQGLTRYDVMTGQTVTLSALEGDTDFRYEMCMDAGNLYILDQEKQSLIVWSMAENRIIDRIPLPEDFPMGAPVFAVSRGVAIFYDDGEIYEDKLKDTLIKTFHMLDVNTGEARRFAFGPASGR